MYEGPLQFPVTISHPKLKKVIDEHIRLRIDLEAEWERLNTLEQDRAKAEDADRLAYAAAIRADKGDPGTASVDAADKVITAAGVGWRPCRSRSTRAGVLSSRPSSSTARSGRQTSTPRPPTRRTPSPLPLRP